MSSRSLGKSPRKAHKLASPRRHVSPLKPLMAVRPLESCITLMVPCADVEQTQRVTTEKYNTFTTSTGDYVTTSCKTVAENKISVSPRK